ncbi:MAG: DUF6624 domain-containing protein [Phycisphaerales bacterium]
MRYATTTAVCALSLALAAGCAHHHQRAANAQPNTPQRDQSVARVDSASIVAHVALSDADKARAQAELGVAFPVYDRPASTLTWDEVASELIAMRAPAIAQYRRTAPESERDPIVHEYVMSIDRAHIARLREIVSAKGWPGPEQVGARAASAAILATQYAGEDLDFLEDAIGYMTPMVEAGVLHGGYVAVLTDRLRVYRGQPQLYGTQMRVSPDAYGLPIILPATPIEDPEHLDARRESVGLPPHASFKTEIAQAYASADH